MTAAIPTAATAQELTASGTEYLIGGELPRDQVYPALSFDATGGYLVWQDSAVDGKGGGSGVAALRLDGDLNATGAPFRVPEKSRGQQLRPQVSALSNGGAIFVWESGGRGSNNVFARFVRPDSSFLTGDLQVSPSTRTLRTNYLMNYLGYRNNKLGQRKPRVIDSTKSIRERSQGAVVGALPEGGAVVVYTSTRRSFTNAHAVVQKITRVRNRSYTNDIPQLVSGSQDFMQDVFFQRFDATGTPVGGEVVVNQWAKYNQRDASIAVLPDGSFVVAYVSEKAVLNGTSFSGLQAGTSTLAARVDINARLFSSLGEPLGNEFTVNSAARTCASPAVSALPDGHFTVVWEQRDLIRTNGWDLYARAYQPNASAAGEAIAVNTFTYGDQFSPRIATAGNQQLIVWLSKGQDKDSQQTATQILPDGTVVTSPTGRSGTWQSVYGRVLAAGVPVGTEFRINGDLGRQLQAQVTGDASGRFLVAWTRFNGDNGFDLFGRRYLGTGSGSETLRAGAFARGASAGREDGISASLLPRQVSISQAGLVDLSGEIRLPVLTFTGTPERRAVTWNTQVGGVYQVQSTTDLKSWINVGPLRSGLGGNDSVAIGAGQGMGFYRVVRVQ